MAAINSQTLFEESKCFTCLGISTVQALRLALLKRAALDLDAMAATSANALLDYAKCFLCYSNGSIADALELALLDMVSQGIADIADNPQLYSGVGSPEGVVTAEVGSIYTDLTDTDNPILYTKTTGSGNTGWV